jgi:hypothetical protein
MARETAPAAVLLSLDTLGYEESARFVSELRQLPQLARTPVVGLTDDPPSGADCGIAGVDAWQGKFDRTAMLASLDRLHAALDRSSLAAPVLQQEAVRAGR